jgi:hypothetical protein
VVLFTEGVSLSLAAHFAAQRLFNAATIAALPAALSFRFGFLADFGPADSPFGAAHLLRCASAIARRPAALIPRLLPFLECDAEAE